MITLTAKIYIDNNTELLIERNNIKSISLKRKERDDNILPSWNFVSNSGTIQFYDFDRKVSNLSQQGKLIENLDVDIILKNTNSSQSICVKGYTVNKWKYDSNDLLVSVYITDNMEKMQDVSITLAFDLGNDENYYITALQMYDFLHKKTIESGFDMISSSNDLFDKDTFEYLNNFKIYIPYIKETTLWSAWSDFCIAFQLHIFKNTEGKIQCVYRGGD